MEVVTRRVQFREYGVDLSEQWLVDEDGNNLVAVLPLGEGPFVANIVMTPVTDADPTAGATALPGSVLLGVGRFAGGMPATEVVFGYPLDAVAVTAVQLVGDPSPDGQLVVTFSADAEQFADLWPSVASALRTLQVIA